MTITWVRVLAVMVALGMLVTGLPDRARADGGGGSNARPATATPAKPVDADYTAAVKAIKADKFAAAIPLLEGVVKRDAANADAYNWLGYATRKNGDPAASIPFYQKALALDPKHKGAHEYIGEAYLMLGDLPKAKEHLVRLDSLCLFSCEEFRDLKKAVEKYEKGGGKTSGTRP
jgi:tetratricopeptide (TPR) repeat protein